MISEYDIVLDCEGCGKTFKITVEKNLRIDTIPCPSCKTRDLILFEKEEGKSDFKPFFQRTHTPRILEGIARVADAPPTATPLPQRTFRNVAHVKVDKSNLRKRVDLAKKPDLPPPSIVAPLPESRSPQIRALSKAELRKNLKKKVFNPSSMLESEEKNTTRIAHEEQTSTPDTKLDKVDPPQKSASQSEKSAPGDTLEALLKIDHTEENLKEGVSAKARTLAPPNSTQEVSSDANENNLELYFLPPQPPFDAEALELGIEIKHGQEKALFGRTRLKKLIRSEVWLGGFEANLNGRWVKFTEHPAFNVLKEELNHEARERWVAITQEVDRPPHRPEENDAPALFLPPAEKSSTPSSLTPPLPSANVPSANESQPPQEAPNNAHPTSKLVYFAPVMILLVLAGYFVSTRPEEKPAPLPQPPVVIKPPPEAIYTGKYIFSRAKRMGRSASFIRQKSRKELLFQSAEALGKANFGEALNNLYELKRRNPDDREVIEKLIIANLGRGKFREAREEIVKLVSLEGESKTSSAYFTEALTRDHRLKPEIVEIDGLEIEAIKALGGGKSISFKFKKEGKNVYAFKPSQFEWEDGWEGEVASYRFCEIATCGFRIPRSRASKISRANFKKLYAMNSSKQKSYANRFKDLVWKREIVNGKKTDYLYGVLKDWVPHMVDWPIEYTVLWSKWLDPQYAVQTKLAVLPELDVLKEKNLLIWRQLRKEMNLPIGRVAGELSNLLSFDYLVNNWDRFSEKEDFYGVNNQFSNGHFLSLDNGAAFGCIQRESKNVF